jgi:uncharacterized integral membrane protein (TIGR00697 family)
MSKVKEIVNDYKLLLRSIPGIITTFFCISIVLMNVLANKVILNLPFVAGDGGLVLSWIVFLCMDTVTKRYGAKAANRLNVIGLIVSLFFVGVFSLVSAVQIEVGCEHVDYSAFNSVFSATWFVVLGSSIAFITSGVVNNLINEAIGKSFKKNPDGKLAFYCRSYVSTFIGQCVDNFLFALIVFVIFAPIYWGFSLTITQCIGSAILGGVTELLMEVIFSPIGYKISQAWKRDNVGAEYLEKYGQEVA